MNTNGNNKYKRLLKDTGLFTISSFGSKILTFLLTPLYTSILATEEFGVADLFITTISFLYPVLTLAISEATLRFAFDKEIDQKKVYITSNIIIIISTVILFLCKNVLCLIDDSFDKYWIVFVINYFLFNIHNNLSNYIKGMEKTKLFAIQGLLQTLTVIICNIFFLIIIKMGLNGYLLSIIIGYLVPISLMFVGGKLYRFIFPLSFDKNLMIEMIKYSCPMIPILLAWSINTSIDKYMIIWTYGLGESGIYSVAHKIPTIITTILTVFIQAWQISVISNHGSKDESKFYTDVFNILDLVSLCGCFFIMLICKPLAHFLFAKEFYSAWIYVPLLVISAMFSSHAGFLAAAYRAAKKTNSLFISVLAGAVFNIALNFILLNTIGVIGAAIATAVSFMIVYIVRAVLVQKIVKVKIKVIQSIVSYSLLFLCATLIIFDNIFVIPFTILSFVIVCFLKKKILVSLKNQIIKLFLKNK